MSLTAADVAEILKLLESSSFDTLDLEISGAKLSLRRGSASAAPTPVGTTASAARAQLMPAVSPPAAPAPTELRGDEVTAPLLGTFYRAPKPGAPPFVDVGSVVEADTVIAIIEVMKLMNTVRAGRKGRVTEILVGDGALVEYGQPLLRLWQPLKRISRVFIANRGEIAVRILRTCRRLELATVLGASSADLDSLPARLADRTLCIGGPRSTESYLNVSAVVHAAVASGCDALHPGYGFLSERAVLARTVEEAGLAFIGPTPAQIDAVGDKLRAREAAKKAAVPVVPGGAVDDAAAALELARTIGAPLLVKAVGGGGGRGMKLVERLEDLPQALELASAEAGAAFGDARVYLERYVARGRHVEVQVLGDGAGHVIHLGERDCSVQRRYQKLIEETPAPALSVALREGLHEAAVRFARSLDYRGAGTVEFLVDADRDEFYFLEMNARIQVEHPVTEAVTGIDLIEQQIAIADGRGLSLRQADVRRSGWAIECRVNAEDPAAGFQPSPGTVTVAQWPAGEGIRVDTHIQGGSRVPPFYDSMVGKIIAHGPDRPAALARLRQALAATRLTGIATNLAFQATLLDDPAFIAGGVDTAWLSRRS